jgi:hypothetical protein
VRLVKALGITALVVAFIATCIGVAGAFIIAFLERSGNAALIGTAGCLLLVLEAMALVALLPTAVRLRAGLQTT